MCSPHLDYEAEEVPGCESEFISSALNWGLGLRSGPKYKAGRHLKVKKLDGTLKAPKIVYGKAPLHNTNGQK